MKLEGAENCQQHRLLDGNKIILKSGRVKTIPLYLTIEADISKKKNC